MTDVKQLLKERNAYLTLVRVDGGSFHCQILRPEMDLNAFGQAFHLSVRLNGPMLRIVLDNKDAKQRLTES